MLEHVEGDCLVLHLRVTHLRIKRKGRGGKWREEKGREGKGREGKGRKEEGKVSGGIRANAKNRIEVGPVITVSSCQDVPEYSNWVG